MKNSNPIVMNINFLKKRSIYHETIIKELTKHKFNTDNTESKIREITKKLIRLEKWNNSELPEYIHIENINKVKYSHPKIYKELLKDATDIYQEWKKTALPRDIKNSEEIKEILLKECNLWDKDYPPPIPPPLTDDMIKARDILLKITN